MNTEMRYAIYCFDSDTTNNVLVFHMAADSEQYITDQMVRLLDFKGLYFVLDNRTMTFWSVTEDGEWMKES